MNRFQPLALEHDERPVASRADEAPRRSGDGPSLPDTLIEITATLAGIAGIIVAVLGAVDLLS